MFTFKGLLVFDPCVSFDASYPIYVDDHTVMSTSVKNFLEPEPLVSRERGGLGLDFVPSGIWITRAQVRDRCVNTTRDEGSSPSAAEKCGDLRHESRRGSSEVKGVLTVSLRLLRGVVF